MDFFLIANFSRENVPAVTQKVCDELLRRECGICLWAEPVPGASYPAEVQLVAKETACRHADMIICIGGDGTIIDGAHCSAAYGLPVLGINAGRLGFLAQVEPEGIAGPLTASLPGIIPSSSGSVSPFLTGKRRWFPLRSMISFLPSR